MNLDMDNQHQKISGYRELTQAEIDLMNEIKAKGVELEQLIGKLYGHVSDQWEAADSDEASRLAAADPDQWLMEGKRQLQTGLMALTRAIAQPTTF
jgi:hypothetical protein